MTHLRDFIYLDEQRIFMFLEQVAPKGSLG